MKKIKALCVLLLLLFSIGIGSGQSSVYKKQLDKSGDYKSFQYEGGSLPLWYNTCELATVSCDTTYDTCQNEDTACVTGVNSVTYHYIKKVDNFSYGYCVPIDDPYLCTQHDGVLCLLLKVYEYSGCSVERCTYLGYTYFACAPPFPGGGGDGE